MARSTGDGSLDPLAHAEPVRAGNTGQVQGHYEGLPIDSRKRDVRRLRNAGKRFAVDDQVRYLCRQLLFKRVPQRGQMLGDLLGPLMPQLQRLRHIPTANATGSVPGRIPAC